ncbi:sialidase family protein [Paenibacillus cymbidii]|uniref:sialidase family protein n=1 Tax=Paenibacillus cymbidii TaxID=1639034 RepID=UPI001436717D|nr:sialidase family protein [Paenibacillus cymbidii]
MSTMQAPQSINVSGKIGPFITLEDGTILSIYAEGREHSDWNNTSVPQHLYSRLSFDNGDTWGEPRMIASHPGIGAVALPYALFADTIGQLHQIYCVYRNWDKHVPYVDRIVEMWGIRSADQGNTWSEPQQIDYGHSYTGSINNVTVLGSGRIVMSFSYLTRRQTGCFTSTAIFSDDHGQTWKHSTSDLVLDNGGGHSESGAVEPVTVELPDGRIWMVIRTQTGRLYESFSVDGGESWSDMQQTSFVSSNSPAGLLRLRDGRILMCWNHGKGEPIHHGISYARQSLVAAICGDDGTWRGYRQIVGMKREHDVKQLFCYPWMTELPDGSVLVGYYDVNLANFMGTLVFKAVRIRPEWVVEPEAQTHFADHMHDLAVTNEGVEVIALSAEANALRIAKVDAGKPAGATWNFPIAGKGELTLHVKINRTPFGGTYVSLGESFLLPHNREGGLFRLKIEADGRLAVQYANEGPYVLLERGQLPADEWAELRIEWDCTYGNAAVSVNGVFANTLPQLEQGDGISYVRLFAAEVGEGIQVGSMNSLSRDWEGAASNPLRSGLTR